MMLPSDRYRTAAEVLGAWLGTALAAALTGAVLLFWARGKIVSLLGVAGSLDLLSAVLAVGYGVRRTARLWIPGRACVAGQRDVPAALLGVAAVVTGTALLAAIAMLTAR